MASTSISHRIAAAARRYTELAWTAARQSADDLRATIRSLLAGQPPEAVVRLRLRGPVPEEARGVLSAASLRALAPATMNLSLALAERRGGPPPRRPG